MLRKNVVQNARSSDGPMVDSEHLALAIGGHVHRHHRRLARHARPFTRTLRQVRIDPQVRMRAGQRPLAKGLARRTASGSSGRGKATTVANGSGGRALGWDAPSALAASTCRCSSATADSRSEWAAAHRRATAGPVLRGLRRLEALKAPHGREDHVFARRPDPRRAGRQAWRVRGVLWRRCQRSAAT